MNQQSLLFLLSASCVLAAAGCSGSVGADSDHDVPVEPAGPPAPSPQTTTLPAPDTPNPSFPMPGIPTAEPIAQPPGGEGGQPGTPPDGSPGTEPPEAPTTPMEPSPPGEPPPPEEPTPPEPPEPSPEPTPTTTPASGISLTEIEFNQAIPIPLVEDGEIVEPGDRVLDGNIQVDLVMHRGGLFRVFYELDDDFQDRDLTAVLTLRDADGNENVLTDTRFVDGSPDRSSIDGTFGWKLDGEMILPGTEYAVELVEEEGSTAPPADTAPRVPQNGFTELGVPDQEMKLHLTMFSVRMNGVEPELDDEAVQRLVDGYYDVYPISEVVFEVRDGIDAGEVDLDDDPRSVLIEELVRTRQSDDPEPNRHYIGLAAQDELGWSGRARPSQMVAISPMTDDVNWKTVEFAVHETGHTIGMDHTPGCGASGTVNDWPYDDAGAQVQGYGIRYDRMYDPDDFSEFMSYCAPIWVSPYTYMLSYELIREENDRRDQGPRVYHPILNGALYASGKTSWWSSVGELPDAPRGSRPAEIHITSQTGAQSVEVGYVEAISDGTSEHIAATLPIPFDQIAQLEVRLGERRFAIDPASLQGP